MLSPLQQSNGPALVVLSGVRQDIGADLQVMMDLSNHVRGKFVFFDLGIGRGFGFAFLVRHGTVKDLHGSLRLNLVG